MTISAHRPWSSEACRLDEFVELVEVPTAIDEYPNAAGVEQGVLVYEADRLREATATLVRAELADAILNGPGIVKVASAFDSDVLDPVTATFDQIIADERAAGTARGDHYAKPGANDRVWNALQKLALRDPAGFVDYYANDVVALLAVSWLGPAYQITSQVNVVNPGGDAQQPHRDYHLGFMTDERAAEYPPHVHQLSPVLTLQAAVAHCDMPVESGPTMYLPHSQKYAPRVHGVAPAGVHRLLRRALRAAPARQGRRRVPQPGAVPRRRRQPLRPTCAAWPTCCRSPRRSGGRWRRWTARRW